MRDQRQNKDWAIGFSITQNKMNNSESNEENINKDTSGMGSLEAKQPGDKIKDSIEEISFSENSPVGEIGYQDDASSEIEEAPDAGENSDKQSEMGSTVGGTAPKILKVKHTAQYNHARPKTEQGLGDWVFDYPK